MMLSDWTYYSSGHILVLARRSYSRIDPAEGTESEIPIILSAIALEALMNDLEHHAVVASRVEQSRTATNLERVLAEAETGNAKLLLKIDLAHLVLTGGLPDKGAQPYQDIQLLIKLRNMLVHLRPEKVRFRQAEETGTYPPIVMNFVARGIIPPPTNSAVAWSQYVIVPAVAAWAYNTAVGAFKWFAAIAPDDSQVLKVTLTQRTNDLIEIPV